MNTFEDRYRESTDPWNFAGSPYERSRYRTVIESLPRPSYGRAFEPGCSVGELTACLAEICGHVIATEDPDDDLGHARTRALKVRHLVERWCTEVLDRFGRATGPQLLCFDSHAANQHMALGVYIRQCHAERDLELI